MDKETDNFIKRAEAIMLKYNCGIHQVGDYLTKEDNEANGRELCGRCEGTGNELFSMYKKCSECNGKGYKRKP